MKKVLRIAALALALTLLSGVFGAIALADEDDTASYPVQYKDKADILFDLGLFKGQTTGYNLDKAATRAEAATMLVRLLGLEKEVAEGTYEHPFTDVPAWAENVVGYMYEEGLTKGVSATKFGSGNACEAKMYVTFVLRALGYDESTGDFKYDEAMSDVVSLQVMDLTLAVKMAGKTFLRDDMVAVSFCALSANPKGATETILLDKLVSDGVVAKEKAAAHRGEFDAYKAYRFSASLQIKEFDATMKITMNMDVDGEKQSMIGDISLVAEGLDKFETAKLKMVGSLTLDGASLNITCYLKDGWIYLSLSGLGVDSGKMKMDLSPLVEMLETEALGTESLSDILDDMASAGDLDMSALQYAMIDFVSAKLISFSRTTTSETASYEFGDFSTTYVYDGQGRISSSQVKMEIFGVKADVAAEFRYPAGGVKVDFSGLKEADYEEIDSGDLF